MSEPTQAFTSEGLPEALLSWGTKWLEYMPRYCDWCHAPLTVEDLREYIAWCMTLRKAWPSTAKRLPKDWVFCLSCAVGAINELHGGPRHVPSDEPIPF